MENNENVEITKKEEKDDFTQMLDRADQSLEKLSDTLAFADNVVNKVKEVTVAFTMMKQIDLEIKQIDFKLEQFLKESDVKLEKFKTSAVIIEKQLERFSNKIDKILNSALSIDTKTTNVSEIQLRTGLLTQVNNWGDTVSTMLMRLMGM